MPDFTLGQMPNFTQALLGGMEAGRRIGQQRRVDQALDAYDASRPETAIPVLKADQQLGTALLGAAQRMQEFNREAAGREALTGFLLKMNQKGGGPASGVPQAAGSSPAPAEASAEGDVVVTAPREEPDPAIALIKADPMKWLGIQDNLARLDSNAREKIAAAAEAQGTVAMAASRLPYAERAAFIDSQRSFLVSHGVDPAEIAAFDPTDANIQAQADQALGVKGILAQKDREADNARQERNTQSMIASRGLRDGLAVRSDRRASEARAEGRVRFKERDKDRAAIAAGGRGLPTNTDDLDY